MYQVSFEKVDWFLRYEVRLKFCDDTDDEAKGVKIARLYSSKNIQAKNKNSL